MLHGSLTGMNRPLPTLALLLGLAGLIPFIAFGIYAVAQNDDRAAFGLVAYGAVILAFLGGVHWGFALEEPNRRGERARLSLGVAPSLVGWVGLLLSTALAVNAGLALILAGFIGTTALERRALQMGLMPPSYMRLRYMLSAIVVLVLTVVLVLRVLGVRIALP